MLRELKSVQFVFENCEEFEISAEYVETLAFSRINSFVRYYNMGSAGLFDGKIAGKMQILLKPEANFIYRDTLNDAVSDEERCTTFQRILKWRDITAIALEYDNGDTDTYYTDYDEGANEGKLGAENVHQRAGTQEDGTLWLKIGRG